MVQFALRATNAEGRWLISAQGWSASDSPGITMSKVLLNPVRVRLLANAFSVLRSSLIGVPGLLLRSNPGLKLANAFGVVILKSNYITLRSTFYPSNLLLYFPDLAEIVSKSNNHCAHPLRSFTDDAITTCIEKSRVDCSIGNFSRDSPGKKKSKTL